MRIANFYLSAIVLIFLIPIAQAAPIPNPSTQTLDFENIADLTVLGALGQASFSGAYIASAGLTLNEFEVPPHSGTNVALNEDASMIINFANGVQAISGFVTYSSPLIIKFYGGSGELGNYSSLFSSNLALSGDPQSSANEYFSFNSIEPITGLSIISQAENSFALDDLTFSVIEEEPRNIPEPNTIALWLLGIVILIGINKRIRPQGVIHLVLLSILVFCRPASAQSASTGLVVYPQNVSLSTPTVVKVTIQIPDPAYIAGSGVLNEIDANNKVVKRLAIFSDGGTAGDEIAGDRRYTATFVINEAAPRLIRIAASLGFIGTLTRVTSASSIVWVSVDNDPTRNLAVVEDDALTFRDAIGNLKSTIKLAKFDITSVTLPAGIATETTYDTAFVSESQQRAGLISSRTLNFVNEDEGDTDTSLFRLFNSDGSLLFIKTSTPGRTYFVDPQLEYISRAGSRLILTEVDDNHTDPIVKYLDDLGNILAEYTNLPNIESILEAHLSSNGRYIAVIGNGTTARGRQIVIVVIDTLTSNISQRLFDEASTQSVGIAENISGSFNIIIGGTLGEQLP